MNDEIREEGRREDPDGQARRGLGAALGTHCGELAQSATQAGRYLGQSLRLMVGMPDYSTYLAHMAAAHPGEAAMTYEEFFRERQQARYGGGKQGACC